MVKICILTYIPANVEVPWDHLFNGACANPDGHGWAVAKGDQLVIGKSMDMFKAAEDYEQALKDMPGAVSLFHSRIATAGTVDEFNVHPFWVGGTDHTVMAHNGILPERWQPERGDPTKRSDTQIFADQMGWLIDNPNGVPSRRMGRKAGEAIGTYNKLVFISVKAGHPMVRIVNAQVGVWTDGVWHSNRSFENYRPSFRRPGHRLAYDRKPDTHWSEWKPTEEPARYGSPYGSAYGGTPVYGYSQDRGSYTPGGWNRPYDWEAEEVEDCLACKGLNIDNAGYCQDCTTCQECMFSMADCDCYVPRGRPKQGPEDEVDAWLAAREDPEVVAELREADEQDREWAAYLAEVKAKQKQPGETWDEFIVRQAALRKEKAEATSPTVVQFKAPLMIEQ